MASKNFGDVARSAPAGPAAPPDGKYLATITATNVRKSSNGKPMLGARCVVDSGEHNGKSIWFNQTLSVENETSIGIFIRMMVGFGVTPEFFDNYSAETGEEMVDALSELLVGKRAQIVVASRADLQGNPRQDVKFVNGLPDNAPAPEIDLDVKPASATGPKPPTASGPRLPAGPPRTPRF